MWYASPVVPPRITSTREYLAIAAWYGSRVAERSQVPLMRHVDDGLTILARIDATDAAMRAFCLHPLVQEDADFVANAARLGDVTTDPYVAALAVEYRNVANAALSTRVIAHPDEIALSPLRDVNDMLVADKVQNRKDFVRHHASTHPRAAELARYFELWLARLQITESHYEALIAGL